MDAIEFRIRSSYDHHVVKEMSRVMRRTTLGKISVAARVFGWAVVALYAVLELVLWTIDAFSFNPLVFLMFAAMLALLLFEDELNAWLAARSLIPGTREADTVFGADGYVVSMEAAETHWTYGRIVALAETKDSFFIFVSKRHVQQFPKAGMESGTPEQFRAFLAEKTGLPVRYVKSFMEKERSA